MDGSLAGMTMNDHAINKNKRILDTIEHLTNKFGAGSFKVVDHWDADLCAVGFSDNLEKHLIYISTFGMSEDHFFVSLENTRGEDDFPYEPAGDFDKVDLVELERLFEEHLGLKTTGVR